MTDQGLIQLATRLVASFGGEIISKANGDADWGRFGCIVATTAELRMQVWIINKGPHNVLVTYTSPNPPDQTELAEAERIAMAVAVTNDQTRTEGKRPSLWKRPRGGE